MSLQPDYFAMVMDMLERPEVMGVLALVCVYFFPLLKTGSLCEVTFRHIVKSWRVFLLTK